MRSTLATLLGRDASVAFVVTEAVKEAAQPQKLQIIPAAVSSGKEDIISSALNIFDSGKVIRRDPV